MLSKLEQDRIDVMDRILVALDGSAHSDKALDLAADLAETYQAELLLVHVLSSAPLSDAERDMAAVEYVDELAEWTTRHVKPATGGIEGSGHELLMHYSDLARHFREIVGKRLIAAAKKKLSGRKLDSIQMLLADGDPAQTILYLAKDHKADAIVMGSRGLSDIKGLLMGSVSHKVSHLAECTCITVK
ncbi:MAG: universal stress protein [Geminicoccales bacterium]